MKRSGTNPIVKLQRGSFKMIAHTKHHILQGHLLIRLHPQRHPVGGKTIRVGASVEEMVQVLHMAGYIFGIVGIIADLCIVPPEECPHTGIAETGAGIRRITMRTQQVQLRDGQVVTIRSVVPEDAAKILEYVDRVSGETDYLAQGRGELGWTLEDNKKINAGIQFMGGEIGKIYRIYGKDL